MAKFLFIFMVFVIPGVLAQAKMVYLSEVGEQRRVVLAEDDGTFIKFLTSEHQQSYHPEMSSDGRYVAYSIGTIEPGNIDVAVHIQDLETGEIEIWTDSGSQYIHAEFSADGRWLAFSGPVQGKDNAVKQQIQMIDLQGERKKGSLRTEERDGVNYRIYQPAAKVIESEYDCFFPTLATDGRFVIFHRTKDFSNKETAKELVKHSFIDGSTALLTEENGHAMVPSLSADDRYLAYASVVEGQWDIFVMDLWDSSARQITDSKTKEFTPVFAPDGTIYYSHITEGDRFEIDLYKIPREQVFASIDKAAQPEAFIAEPGVFEYVPSFSGKLTIKLLKQPDLPSPARSSFGAIEHRGLIYIAGGHQGKEHTYPPESFLDQAAVFNPETGKWKELAPLSHPRHGFQLVAHGDYLYAFGGFAYSANHSPGWQSLDIIERYNISENRWEVLPERLPRRRSSNVALRVDTKVYFIGGWNSTPKHHGDLEGRFHSEVDVFDLETLQAYDSGHRIPSPLRRALTAVEHEGEIFLLGGISEGASHFAWLDNVTIFNPETGVWREGPSLPFATFAPGAGILEGRIYLFGGMNKSFNYVNTIYELDLNPGGQGLWQNTGRYLQENKGFPMVVNHPKKGLGILGGHTYIFTGSDSVIDTPVQTFEWLL